MAGKTFQTVKSLRPGRSVFNLSFEVKTTFDMGQLIPIMCEEVVPGDTWKIGNEVVVRFMPLVAPILHEVNAIIHYYFVPTRLLDPNWEGFITGGFDGLNSYTLPRWIPTAPTCAVGTLWDYFGFPPTIIPAGAYPLAYARRAYNLVYNQYYKDETLIADVSLDSEAVQISAWEKDYFTSALPFQQRGTAPGLPVTISGATQAVFAADVGLQWPAVAGTSAQALQRSTSGSPNYPFDAGTKAALELGVAKKSGGLDNNSVSLSPAVATTFNVSDLRLAFQVQKWMERNARGGARYIESLQSHFGVAPRDERLQRAEYIGGSRSPVVVSEVLQTSAMGATPQANMAGHGLTADRNFICTYRAEEYGYILGIMKVMPRPAYCQGINRQWLRTTRYDFYWPEFANLSEQAVLRAELYADAVSGNNNTVFGYQGRYDEMRVKNNQATGLMRPGVAGSLGYWNLVRQFASAPSLNQTFIECVPRKDIFAAPSQPGLLVNVRNVIKAIRPLPIEADPGLIDHH